ncbi:hypothetical protein PIB30_030690 [Stylosanthes scabra]|uniref:RNase H type-1 domain-containing protein n=1 Tax=Stylosanthes scabra TaxID=79078 RepID=A0ABU6SBC9_9FABA|nr:hypothetical protein [Stylosanthes scabra]
MGIYFPNGNLASFGCVARDCQSTWLRGCFGSVRKTLIIRCELLAIWHGLWMVWEMGECSVMCETDCLDAYNLIHANSMAGAHQDLVTKILDFLFRPWDLTILLIDQSANGVADLLAKQTASSNHGFREWVTPFPDERRRSHRSQLPPLPPDRDVRRKRRSGSGSGGKKMKKTKRRRAKKISPVTTTTTARRTKKKKKCQRRQEDETAAATEILRQRRRCGFYWI